MMMLNGFVDDIDYLWVVKNMIAETIKMGMFIVVITGSRIFASWGLSALLLETWKNSK